MWYFAKFRSCHNLHKYSSFYKQNTLVIHMFQQRWSEILKNYLQLWRSYIFCGNGFAIGHNLFYKVRSIFILFIAYCVLQSFNKWYLLDQIKCYYIDKSRFWTDNCSFCLILSKIYVTPDIAYISTSLGLEEFNNGLQQVILNLMKFVVEIIMVGQTNCTEFPKYSQIWCKLL